MHIDYIRSRTRFHAKTTVSGVSSKLRCMGESIWCKKWVWIKNPMRWVKGPRLDWRGQTTQADWEGTSDQDAGMPLLSQKRGAYQQHLSIAVLALLYGTGWRRGELERLDSWPIGSGRKGCFRLMVARRGRSGTCPYPRASGDARKPIYHYAKTCFREAWNR